MGIAREYAKEFSDDPDTQVGACITRGQDVLVRATNTVPHGVRRDKERCERPIKYDWIEHAEQAAIAKAARDGVELEGTRMYCTLFPCNLCAQSIINAGICRLITPPPDMTRESASKYTVALEMLIEAGVEIFYVEGEG
jgi:dCMP deaminase